MTDSTPLVLQDRDGAVLTLTLNRPERHHALSSALTGELEEALEQAQADPDVRCIILTGSGTKAFCAGGDMLEMSGVEQAVRRSGTAGGAIGMIDALPMPIIAAVNGYCYGGGARLAIACDIRIASTTATFRLPGSEYGLVVGAAQLPRLMGASMAKELIFTARKFDAEEALRWGMVNSLHEPDALMPAAMAMAQTITKHSVEAIRASKRVIDAATLSDTARQMENEANRGLRGSPEQTERFREATTRVTGR